jgi:hypothetical protein
VINGGNMAYDIYIHPLDEKQVYSYKCFGFGFVTPIKVDGFLSLVGRWVRTLLTPKGSDIFDANYGTSLGHLPGSNITDVGSDIKDIINLAIEDANEQVKAQDLSGMYTTSEQLQSAIFSDYQYIDKGINVFVTIQNVAGDRYKIRTVVINGHNN